MLILLLLFGGLLILPRIGQITLLPPREGSFRRELEDAGHRKDQLKPRQQARELLAPVYGCLTEGSLDLKEAKALLEELAA